MKENLHIVEISPHIYAGAVNTRASIDGTITKGISGFFTPAILTGGIAFLFNKIADFSIKGQMIFVSDRNPTIKKQIYPNYKANRSKLFHDPKRTDYYANIENQKEIAEQILEDCGFKVFYEEGYEADDILYSICEKYHQHFNHIFIHADDSDNYINIRENVSILPCGSTGKIVTKDNYETTVNSKTIVPYCSSTFSKFLFGDKSDGVDALPEPMRSYIIKIVWKDNYFPFMREKKMMRALIEHICPEALVQFDAIYPLDVEVELGEINTPFKGKVEAWGAAIDCNRFKNRKVITNSIQPMIDKFFSEGRALEQ